MIYDKTIKPGDQVFVARTKDDFKNGVFAVPALVTGHGSNTGSDGVLNTWELTVQWGTPDYFNILMPKNYVSRYLRVGNGHVGCKVDPGMPAYTPKSDWYE